ncbi:MAG: transcriptional repressor LexA, partial [Myxococcales bacterium]|nr:transcriptional repressor LexA [Myxococcales bacterium]
MKVLTQRQEQILAFLIQRTREQGYPPTFREIGDHFGIASTNGVMKNLAALERKGYIRRKDRASRAIEIQASAFETELAGAYEAPLGNVIPVDFRRSGTTLPLVGRIAAGLPIEAIETPEVIEVGATFAVEASFVLQVQGDSMIEDCIADGDYVIVERRET